MVYSPFSYDLIFHSKEYGSVVSVIPVGIPSTNNSNESTPILSDKIQLTETTSDIVEPLCGEVMVTIGEVVSSFSESVSIIPSQDKPIKRIIGKNKYSFFILNPIYKILFYKKQNPTGEVGISRIGLLDSEGLIIVTFTFITIFDFSY